MLFAGLVSSSLLSTSHAMSLPRRTIVVGAGLGGLTLGQCLRAKNIPVTILEKASSSLRFNYSITLRRSVYQPLLAVLNLSEASFLEQCSIGLPEAQMDSTTFRWPSRKIGKSSPQRVGHQMGAVSQECGNEIARDIIACRERAHDRK